MDTVLYCALKKTSLINELIYSIASIQHIKTNKCDIRFVIVTDMPDLLLMEINKQQIVLKDNIIIEPISQELLAQWVGLTKYIFKGKIYTLQYYMQKYSSNVLMIDCDMFAVKDFKFLFESINKHEFVMYGKNTLDIKHLLNEEALINNIYYDNSYTPGTFYHQSGVIGMHYDYKYLLDKILWLNDAIFDVTQFNSSEELAVYEVLKNENKIINADRYFKNYSFSFYGRYFLAYALNCFAGNDLEELKCFLEILSIDIDSFFQTPLFYDELNIFMQIANYFIRHAGMDYLDLLSDAIIYGIIKNTSEEKRNYKQIFNKFAPIFQQALEKRKSDNTPFSLNKEQIQNIYKKHKYTSLEQLIEAIRREKAEGLDTRGEQS